MDIQRWAVGSHSRNGKQIMFEDHEDGEWVRYTDHVAMIAMIKRQQRADATYSANEPPAR